VKGGARAGAGRPPGDPAKVRKMVSVRLPPDLIEWLRAQEGSQSRIVEAALVALRGAKKGD